jgi:hypothetical protein
VSGPRSGGDCFAAARCFFGVTAASCLLGVGLELWVAYHQETVLPPEAGFTRTFGPGLGGALNQLFFFTTKSNAILGATTLLLALRPHRTSQAFHVWRLVGLIDITITAIVFNLLLAGDVEHGGAAQLANVVQHMINPTLALIGWGLFGPAGTLTRRRILLAAAVPLTWTAVTLVRGALVQWYPYTILDVPNLGYGVVARNILAVLVLFFLIAGVLAVADRRLGVLRGRFASETGTFPLP